MNKADLEKIKLICDKEIDFANKWLDRKDISAFDIQYCIGRQHAAKDIIHNIKHLLEAAE